MRRRIGAGLLAFALILIGTSREALAAVYWGERGAQVRQVQKKLKQWGYFDGAVDGVFGQETYDAVVRFQKKNGLTPDGVAGERTLAAMGISDAAAVSASASAASNYSGDVDSRRSAGRAVRGHGGGRCGGDEPRALQPFPQYHRRGHLPERRV